MNIQIRLYIDGVLTCDDRVERAEHELSAMIPEFAHKHAMVAGDQDYMIEIEFLDEPDPEARFFRFGTDPGRMVSPIKVDLDGVTEFRDGWGTTPKGTQ